MKNNHTGYLNEVFVSIQGEGPYVGQNHLFIRLAGCSRSCAYCDTRQSRAATPEKWTIYGPNKRTFPNPVEAGAAVQIIKKAMKAHVFSMISITGGEPLEQTPFLTELIPALRKYFNKPKILLETNGLEYKAVEKSKKLFDIISMDMKLESLSGLKNTLPQHARFLRMCRGKQGYVKVVFGPGSTAVEIAKAARLTGKYQPNWDFILQPVSRQQSREPAVSVRLMDIVNQTVRVNARTRLIPQIHAWLKVK